MPVEFDPRIEEALADIKGIKASKAPKVNEFQRTIAALGSLFGESDLPMEVFNQRQAENVQIQSAFKSQKLALAQANLESLLASNKDRRSGLESIAAIKLDELQGQQAEAATESLKSNTRLTSAKAETAERANTPLAQLTDQLDKATGLSLKVAHVLERQANTDRLKAGTEKTKKETEQLGQLTAKDEMAATIKALTIEQKQDDITRNRIKDNIALVENTRRGELDAGIKATIASGDVPTELIVALEQIYKNHRGEDISEHPVMRDTIASLRKNGIDPNGTEGEKILFNIGSLLTAGWEDAETPEAGMLQEMGVSFISKKLVEKNDYINPTTKGIDRRSDQVDFVINFRPYMNTQMILSMGDTDVDSFLSQIHKLAPDLTRVDINKLLTGEIGFVEKIRTRPQREYQESRQRRIRQGGSRSGL